VRFTIGLEISDVERVRVQVAVPSHDVERMERVAQPGQPGAVADDHRQVLALDDQGAVRPAQVPLAVGGVLEELPGGGQVPPRRPDVPAGLDDQRVHRLPRRHPAVNCPPGHHNVITGTRVDRAVNGLEPGGAVTKVNGLVAG